MNEDAAAFTVIRAHKLLDIGRNIKEISIACVWRMCMRKKWMVLGGILILGLSAGCGRTDGVEKDSEEVLPADDGRRTEAGGRKQGDANVF